VFKIEVRALFDMYMSLAAFVPCHLATKTLRRMMSSHPVLIRAMCDVWCLNIGTFSKR